MTLPAATTLGTTLPFLGPSPFSEQDQNLFFGRDGEIARLRSLLHMQRIVVLHSPSGAGKTSLIRAGLMPRLRKDKFLILPPVRVGLPLPAGASVRANRYVHSAIRSLEYGSEGSSPTEVGPPELDLTGIRLSAYLAHRANLGESQTRLLIFDQFEEIFTKPPRDERERTDFFNDLAIVLRDKRAWALFAMRAEYVGALDKYTRLLPAQLSARFPLDLLTPAAAREAIVRPAREVGITVDPKASDALIADLTRTVAQGGPESTGAVQDNPEAALIDPLHLQLVCVDVFLRLAGQATIKADDLSVAGREGNEADSQLSAVDRALLRYCDKSIAGACKGSNRLEGRLRSWLDTSLIEGGQFRRQALVDDETDQDMLNARLELERRHVLRALIRLDTKWYEIAHDRMVAPLRLSNDAWYEENLQGFTLQARKWYAAGEPQDFDYLGETELRQQGYGKGVEKRIELLPHEKRYLEFCRYKIKAKKRNRNRVVVSAALILLLSIVLGVVTFSFNRSARLLKDAREDSLAGNVQRLYSSSMTQRWRYQNHDVALLLAKLTIDENESLSQKYRLSKAHVDAPLWSTLTAVPFSQSLPRELLQGEARTLASMGQRIYVSVEPTKGGQRIVAIDTADSRLEFEDASARRRWFSPSRSVFAVIENDRLELHKDSSVAARVIEAAVSGQAPVWSPDERHIAVFLDSGEAVVFQVAGENESPVVHFARAPSGKDAAGGSFPITAVTFYGDYVLAGSGGGRVQFAGLSESAGAREDILGWEKYWPFPIGIGHLESAEKYAAIVAMQVLSRTDGEWLVAVHRGHGHLTRGGWVILYRLADPAERYLLLPDAESFLREELDYEQGRGIKRFESTVSAGFSGDGGWLVTGGSAGTVCRWSLNQMELKRAIPASLLDLEPAGEDGGTRMTVFRTPRRLLRGALGRVTATQVSSDGAHVAAIHKRSEVRLWQLERIDLGYSTKKWGDQGYNYALTFHDDTRLFTSDNRGNVQEWNVALGATDGGDTHGTHIGVVQLRVNPEGAPLKLSTRDQRPLSVRSIDSSGGLLVLGVADWIPRLLDLTRSEAPAEKLTDSRVAHRGSLFAVSVRPNNAGLEKSYDLATSDGSGWLILWDLLRTDGKIGKGKAAASVRLGSTKITGLAFHPRGHWLAATTSNGQLHLIDVDGARCDEQATRFETPSGPVAPCLVSTTSLEQRINTVAFDQDGARLAAAGDAGLLVWWSFDDDSAHPLAASHRLSGASGPIRAVAFLRKEDKTLAATDGGSVLLWTLGRTSFAYPLQLQGEGAEIFSLSVSPDGKKLAAGDSEGRFMVWNLDLADSVCRVVLRNLTETEWQRVKGITPRDICTDLAPMLAPEQS